MQFTSSQIIQIIISLIVLLTSVIGLVTKIIELIKETKKEKQQLSQQISSDGADNLRVANTKKKIKSKVLFIIIMITFITIPISILGNIFYSKFYVEPYITILSPSDKEQVDNPTNITGTFRNIDLKNQFIWVIVKPANDGKYFVERKPATVDVENNEWSNPETAIGAKEDTGEQVEIIVLLVDSSSTTYQEIKSYINNPSSHGLDNLPDGSIIRQKITVFIKKTQN